MMSSSIVKPIVVSVINLKGGVGKSTITALLGRHASLIGIKVLAVDLDPQANLSQAFMTNDYRNFLRERKASIVEIFRGYLPPSSSSGSSRPLDVDDVVVRDTLLGGKNLQLIPSRFDFSDYLVEALKPDSKTLARFLSERFSDRDLILIDCAPTESILTQAAYGASRFILVPVKPEYFATIGFPLLRESLAGYRDRNRGHEIEVAGVVINNAFYAGGNDGGPEKKEALAEIREEAEKNGWYVFKHEIPHSRGFPKMMRGNWNYRGNAEDFKYFASEFLMKIGFPDALDVILGAGISDLWRRRTRAQSQD